MTLDCEAQPGDSEPTSSWSAAQPRLEVDEVAGRTTLLLPLEGTGLPDPAILEQLVGIGFTPKGEFHVTAIDIKHGSPTARAVDTLSALAKTTFRRILHDTQGISWQIRTRNEFYLVEKQYDQEEIPRRSVIQIVDCPDLDMLYGSLNSLDPDTRFEQPPTHLTLATQGNPRGIGIQNRSDLEIFGSRYVLPD